MYNVLQKNKKNISEAKEQVRSNGASVPAHWELPERSHPEIFIPSFFGFSTITSQWSVSKLFLSLQGKGDWVN